MSKYLQIQIPKPCHENWDKMDVAKQGRFCNSCQKNVVDFTLMSDNDLVNFFKKNTGNVCGRFSNSQVNNDIPIPAKKIPWLKYFFTISIPAFLVSLKTSAQTNVVKGKVACVETKQYHKVGEIQIDTVKTPERKTITGVITDEEGKPIAYASVMIKGSKQGVAADSTGKYSISLPYQYTAILISSVGHVPQEITVGSNSNINVTLSRALTGEVVIIAGYIVVKKKHRSPLASLFNGNNILPNTFSIFPNPIVSGSQLNIKWKNNISSDQSIEIYNLAGSLLQQELVQVPKKSNLQNIRLNPLPAGTYVLKVTDSKTRKSSSQQFIVE